MGIGLSQMPASSLYGVLVVRDAFFVFVSLVNLGGCAAVTVIAARRRLAARQLEIGA